MDWLSALVQLREQGRAGVLATVTEARGHSPRDAGAKMVVTVEESWGSIGGGNLEATVTGRARDMLTAGTVEVETLQLPLTFHTVTRHGRQCCGGEVTILLEPVAAPPAVAVFGVGHVGLELARILSRLPVALHLADSRADQIRDERLSSLTDGPAQVRPHHAPAPEAVLSALPAGAHVLIMTHDHAEDLILCDAALRRGDLGTIGVIGSRAKWSRFRRQLREAGHRESDIDRIECPIGLPGAAGKAPAAIAISVAASLLPSLRG